MRKRILAGLLLIATPAFAADSLTITLVTGGNTLTATKPLQASETARIVAAYKLTYPQTCDAATPPVCHVSSGTEVFNAFAAGLFAGIQANVLSAEQASAGKTATDAVLPLNGLK